MGVHILLEPCPPAATPEGDLASPKAAVLPEMRSPSKLPSILWILGQLVRMDSGFHMGIVLGPLLKTLCRIHVKPTTFTVAHIWPFLQIVRSFFPGGVSE